LGGRQVHDHRSPSERVRRKPGDRLRLLRCLALRGGQPQAPVPPRRRHRPLKRQAACQDLRRREGTARAGVRHAGGRRVARLELAAGSTHGVHRCHLRRHRVDRGAPWCLPRTVGRRLRKKAPFCLRHDGRGGDRRGALADDLDRRGDDDPSEPHRPRPLRPQVRRPAEGAEAEASGDRDRQPRSHLPREGGRDPLDDQDLPRADRLAEGEALFEGPAHGRQGDRLRHRGRRRGASAPPDRSRAGPQRGLRRDCRRSLRRGIPGEVLRRPPADPRPPR
jgi:hypothetical protein